MFFAAWRLFSVLHSWVLCPICQLREQVNVEGLLFRTREVRRRYIEQRRQADLCSFPWIIYWSTISAFLS